MKAVLKVLNMTLTGALVLVISVAVVLAISARRSGDAIPTILGHKVLTVLSGSMAPAIHTGDVIGVKPLAEGDQIRENDIITYRSKEKADMLITHRVVGIIHVNGEPRAFVTKGDANQSQDLSTVAAEHVIGRYAWRVPYFGYVSSSMRQPLGIILFVVLPGLTLIGFEFRKMWQALNEAEAAKNRANAGGGDDTSK